MPRIIYPLSNADDQRINRNWTFLKRNIVEHEIRDIFIDKAIWDIHDFETIDVEKTPEEKNETFLKLLLQSGPRAYDVFITALQENGLTHIVEKLQKTPTRDENPEPSSKHYLHFEKQL